MSPKVRSCSFPRTSLAKVFHWRSLWILMAFGQALSQAWVLGDRHHGFDKIRPCFTYAENEDHGLISLEIVRLFIG